MLEAARSRPRAAWSGARRSATSIRSRKLYQHSLRSSVLHLRHARRAHPPRSTRPGFPDFIGQAIGALDAVETAAIVVNAQSGIEMITSRMMEWAAKRKLCRLIIVNKIDAENVDPQAVLAADPAGVRQGVPADQPAGGRRQARRRLLLQSVRRRRLLVGRADAHQALVDQVVEVDEELMAKYLEQGDEIAPEQLHAPFEKALREGHLVPVCFVSARTGAGVDELLQTSSSSSRPIRSKATRRCSTRARARRPTSSVPSPIPKKHVLAHVFKVVMDPFVGKLGIFRVHQGTVTRDTQLFIGDGRKPFKVGHLFMLQGGKNVEVDRAMPGDIAAVAKVDEIDFDCVLHDSHDEDQIHMRPLEFPTPMHGVAITPKKRGDEQRISDVLHRMIAEDPTLGVEHDPISTRRCCGRWATCTCARCSSAWRTQYKLEVDTRPPRIPYRETITAPGRRPPPPQEADRRRRPVRRGVACASSRCRAAAASSSSTRLKGGVIPHQFMPAVQKGVEQVLDARRRSPASRCRTCASPSTTASTIPSTRRKSRSSPPGARRSSTRSRRRGRSCSSRSSPSRSICPDVQHGRHHRRSVVAPRPGDRHQTACGAGALAVTGLAPLVELDGYAARLKSVTGGHGAWSMALSHYEQAPPMLQQQLVERVRETPKT